MDCGTICFTMQCKYAKDKRNDNSVGPASVGSI